MVEVLLYGDRSSVELDPQLSTTLDFVDVFTMSPQLLDPARGAHVVEAARAAHVSDDRLEHAALESYVFNIMNRMVDAFGVDLPAEMVDRAGSVLDRAGSLAERVGSEKVWQPFRGSFPDSVVATLRSVRHGEGDLDAEIRRSIDDRVAGAVGELRDPAADLPHRVGELIDQVGADASEVTMQHFDALRDDWSEPQIYEMVFAAAVSAATARVELAWSALDGKLLLIDTSL